MVGAARSVVRRTDFWGSGESRGQGLCEVEALQDAAAQLVGVIAVGADEGHVERLARTPVNPISSQERKAQQKRPLQKLRPLKKL